MCLYCTAASQYRLSVVAIGNHPEPDCLQELSDTALLNAAKPVSVLGCQGLLFDAVAALLQREMESACLCGETLLILCALTASVCVCVCVCVRERERKRERK